jgi:hypothetical protein
MPTLRIEIAVQSDVGASLRDASNPRNLFYHFASKSLVTAPDDFTGWEPFGTGFMLEKKTNDLTPWQQIKGILENSLDMKRCIDLALAHYGSDAEKELAKLVRNRFLLSERSMVALIP